MLYCRTNRSTCWSRLIERFRTRARANYELVEKDLSVFLHTELCLETPQQGTFFHFYNLHLFVFNIAVWQTWTFFGIDQNVPIKHLKVPGINNFIWTNLLYGSLSFWASSIFCFIWKHFLEKQFYLGMKCLRKTYFGVCFVQFELCVYLLSWGAFIHFVNPTFLCLTWFLWLHSCICHQGAVALICIHVCLVTLWLRNNVLFLLHTVHAFSVALILNLPSCLLVPCLLTTSVIHVGLQTPQTDPPSDLNHSFSKVWSGERRRTKGSRKDPPSPTFYLPLFHPLTDRK